MSKRWNIHQRISSEGYIREYDDPISVTPDWSVKACHLHPSTKFPVLNIFHKYQLHLAHYKTFFIQKISHIIYHKFLVTKILPQYNHHIPDISFCWISVQFILPVPTLSHRVQFPPD